MKVTIELETYAEIMKILEWVQIIEEQIGSLREKEWRFMSSGSSGLWDIVLKMFFDNSDVIKEAPSITAIKCIERLDKSSSRSLELVILYEKNDNTK